MLGLGASLLSPYVEGAIPYSNTKSLSLDGTNDYVDTNYTSNTLFRDSFSFSVWVKPDDGQPSAFKTILGVETGSNADMVELFISTNGAIGFNHISNSALNIVGTSGGVFTNGAQSDFKHIVVTEEKVSSGNATTKVYVNGVDTAFSVLGGGALVISEANFNAFDHGGLELNIGATNDDGTQDQFYDGLIDEVAIFNKVLSSSEVTAIYNSGAPKDESAHDGLLLYYRFEDDVTDTAGTSDGTNNGATFSSTVPS